MKQIAFLLLLTASIAFAQGPEPDPWWKNVEDTQALLMKWIMLLTAVGTAFVGMVFGLWFLIQSKLKELKDRQDRQTEERRKIEGQVNAIALNTPTALNKSNDQGGSH